MDSRAFAFFMLPTRAWEMLAGSLLACIALSPMRFNLSRLVKLVALGLLCALCAHPLDPLHPRGDAVLAVILTSVVIAGDGKWIGNSLPVRTVSRVGDWSYSLYLIHWPLFALATSAYLEQVPNVVRAGLLLLSIGLAYLQYEYIEQRFRHGRPLGGRQLLRLATVTTIVAALPFALGSVRLHGEPGAFAYLHRPNHGLSALCSTGGAINDPPACSTAVQPRVALWGDSFAMHLVPGLLKLDDVGPSMMQITKSACAPIRGVASIDENYDAAWAKTCLAFNERAFKLIAETESVKYVIMSSPYSGYLDPGKLKLYEAGESTLADRSVVVERFIATVRDLQARGKQPILVAPPPRPGFNVGACREQAGSGLLVLGRSGCDFQWIEHESYQRGIIDGLREVHLRTGAALVWTDGPICLSGVCTTVTEDGLSTYKDGGHLSIPGSVWLVPKLGIARLVQN